MARMARMARMDTIVLFVLFALFALAALAALLASAPASAGAQGKLLLTGGDSSVDGAAGGGLTPWAVTGSYATRGQTGATAFVSAADLPGYGLRVAGAALTWSDRVELSLARQDFDTRSTGAALGLPGLHLKQDILGLKLRLAGDAVLDSDRWMPQVAVGLLHKRLDAGGLAATLDALGARRSGTDLYLSATKLFLAQGLLVNGTLRATKANQNGLLGFGSLARDRMRLQPELSLALLLSRQLVLGVEHRAMPDPLNPSALGDGLRADDWADLFLVWAPNKHLSLTLAWVGLGRVVPAVRARRQQGAYLSVQGAF